MPAVLYATKQDRPVKQVFSVYGRKEQNGILTYAITQVIIYTESINNQERGNTMFFLKAVLGCILAAFALSAGAQSRPLSERAVESQKVSLLHDNGTTVTVFLKKEKQKTNSSEDIQNLREVVVKVVDKVCTGKCKVADREAVEKYLKELAPKVDRILIGS